MHSELDVFTPSLDAPNEAKEVLADLLKMVDAATFSGNKAGAVKAIWAVMAYVDAGECIGVALRSPSALAVPLGSETYAGKLTPHETAALRWGLVTAAAAHFVRCSSLARGP